MTEAFFTSVEILRRAGAVPVAMVDARANFRSRLAGVEVSPIPGLGDGGSLNALLTGIRVALAARRTRPDVVLAHNGRYIAALKRLGAPVVGLVHGGKLKRFLKADRLITVNAEQRDGLVALGYPAERIALIPNVLPVDEIPPFVARAMTAPPRIGTLRLLVREKGVDVLVEAVALLSKRSIAVELHIGGTGDQEQSLRTQARNLGITDRVRFHGWVDDQAGFLAGIDLYVMPSRHETFGIGILEAQAAGLAVIASACEGPVSVIRDGETGLLVPPGEARALADAIVELLADPARTASIARAGHADCAARHLLPAVQSAYGRFVLEATRTA